MDRPIAAANDFHTVVRHDKGRVQRERNDRIAPWMNDYCSGPMKYKVPVIPAKAGIQCRSAIADWTPAFAGVTNSNINGPDQ